MSLRKEVIDEVFFPGIEGGTKAPGIIMSPRATTYYEKAIWEWAEDYAGPVETEHRNVGIVAGEKDGIRGHFVQKVIVYLPPPRI